MKAIDAPEKVIFICDGKKCGKYSKEIRNGFRALIKETGLKKEVEIVRMGCSDNCKCAPVISLQPHNVWIGDVAEKNIPAIFKEFFLRDM